MAANADRVAEDSWSLMVKSSSMAEDPIFHFTFLRHGESVGNQENRFQGHADFPLTKKGQRQARALAERWQVEGRTFERAFSSPLLRARQTAEAVCGVLKIPLEFNSDWMEIDNGLLKGMEEAEAHSRFPPPAFMTPYTRFGRTGESRWEVYLRAGRALQHLLDAPPAKYLIVAHGGILNMTMCAVLGIPLQADSSGPRFMFHNTAFADFTYDPSRHTWRMLAFDANPRLAGEETDV
jgi:2,3-bisphosphoglycerate-dependent phosphoglycerate mutase